MNISPGALPYLKKACFLLKHFVTWSCESPWNGCYMNYHSELREFNCIRVFNNHLLYTK